jgi:hypothetical protein
MKKNITQWLDEYGSNHQNQINEIIHFFCVPIIFFLCSWYVASHIHLAFRIYRHHRSYFLLQIINQARIGYAICARYHAVRFVTSSIFGVDMHWFIYLGLDFSIYWSFF